MAKVVSLDGKPLRAGRDKAPVVNSGLVDHLRWMLEEARSGALTSAGYALVWKDGTVSSGFAWTDGSLPLSSLSGCVHMLAADLTDAMRGLPVGGVEID